MSPLFLLRWSLRDLRRKWFQVAAIAMVIAIGTGVYSALSSTGVWRQQSYDRSFAETGMYDLRVKATAGLDVPQGAMLAVLATIPDPTVIAHAEERLVEKTQVDASTDTKTILVPGRIVGLDVSAGGPRLTKVAVAEGDGRTLRATDDSTATAVLERNFAAYYHLPPSGTVNVAGGDALEVVGLGMSPEYFFVTTEEGGLFAQANFAVVFTSLAEAQRLAGRPGMVNDLVLSLREGTDPTAVAAQLQAAFDASDTGLGVTVMTRHDEPAYQMLYDDIDGDRRFWNVFAGLILAGAVFGAFNLSSRMVEAQRREIGIGMALGASRTQLALRPLLVGVEIAFAGMLLGIGMGALAILALRPVYTTVMPLPVWITDFQWSQFARGAALGFVLPLLATAWPVWRSVRMAPVDAIATTHRTPRGGLSRLLRLLPWPRSAFRRMPIGNVLRTPRRTVLTALGIGAAIATLVALLGMLDSFFVTINTLETEIDQQHPDRMVVGLDGFVLENGPEVAAVRDASTVAEVAPVLQVGGHVAVPGKDGFDVIIQVVDMSSHVWAPTIQRGTATGGIVLARAAADDLGVDVGDEVQLTHPVRQGLGYTITTTTVKVAGIQPIPFRFHLYVDRSELSLFGAEGIVNELHVLPATGSSTDDVKRELFHLDGVSSVQPASATTRVIRDQMKQYTSIFHVIEGFIFFLALLIAYNATSINADERRRERATLFAFGLPVRRVMALEIVEGMLYGLLGTAAGVWVGRLILQWMVTSLLSTTMPDVAMTVSTSSGTVLLAVVMGVVAVAVAPLLTLRRLQRMDVPGTLRVVE